MDKQVCSCCGKSKKIEEYYSSSSYFNKNLGKVNTCKTCVWDYVEVEDKKSYDLDKVKSTMRMLDKPFIYDLWVASIDESEAKSNSWSYFKTYMKNIALPQNTSLSWGDSSFISNKDSVKEQKAITVKDVNDKDDKSYNKKWMGEYSPSEIEYLEGYINGLHKDFKIVTENHKDYAKKIAKASLHMDNCFRDVLEGVSGADKRYKDAKDVFDTLSKSAQFSESQRGQNEVGLGCFGRVFELVETKTFIPEHIPTEQDDIDKMLNDFGHILKSL